MKLSGNVAPATLAAPNQGRVRLTPLYIFYELSSDGVTRYRVRLFPNGAWTCECKGFGYRAYCRHVGKCKRQMHVQTVDDE